MKKLKKKAKILKVFRLETVLEIEKAKNGVLEKNSCQSHKKQSIKQICSKFKQKNQEQIHVLILSNSFEASEPLGYYF